MNKMNKKGFTLIEMLVVIAIIAVLVSIIIPVVGNSTVKASAATNAANLRSVVAAVSIKYMEDPAAFNDTTDTTTTVTLTSSNGKLELPTGGTTKDTIDAPNAKSVIVGGKTYSAKTDVMTVTIENNAVVAKYGSYGINDFADIAEDGKYDGTTQSADNN